MKKNSLLDKTSPFFNLRSQNAIQKVFSAIYSLFQISQGLLFHPYQTMQSLVREKVFIWMSFLPSVFLISLTLILRYVLFVTLEIFISQIFLIEPLVNAVKFFGNCLIFFCLYWQLVLGYLLFRFREAWK